MKSPFPMTLKNGMVVVDEHCLCGKRRSQHKNTPVAWGHGGTSDGKCRQFTWDAFYFKEEK